MAYQPQPGTIAYRAIAWLEKQPTGTELTASMWAEEIDVDGATLVTCIKPAIEAGLVTRYLKADAMRPFWYSLGDGAPVHTPVLHVQPVPLPPRTSAPEVPRPGEILPGVSALNGHAPEPQEDAVADAEAVASGPGRTQPAAPAPAEAPETKEATGFRLDASEYIARIGPEQEEAAAPAVPFDAWFSGRTGQMFLRGVRLNEDGDAILTSDDVRVLKAAMSGVPA